MDLCIPTGNFGSLLSAYFAKTMDTPFENIICASNGNKILHDFFATGSYDLRSRPLLKTISPAIDILISSNIERLLWIKLGSSRVKELMDQLKVNQHFEVTSDELQKITVDAGISSGWCSEDDCKATMKRVWNQDRYMADPHTCVAIKVATEFMNKTRPMIVASTAHYSKFVEECKDVFDNIDVGEIQNPPPHVDVEQCKVKKVIHTECIEANYDSVCQVLSTFVTDYFGEN